MAKFNDRDYTLKALKKQLLATELHFRDGSFKDCSCTSAKHMPTISELASEGIGFTKDPTEKEFMKRVRDHAEAYADAISKSDFTEAKADEVREWARDTRRRIDFQKWEGEIPKTAAKDEECSTCKPLFAQKEEKKKSRKSKIPRIGGGEMPISIPDKEDDAASHGTDSDEESMFRLKSYMRQIDDAESEGRIQDLKLTIERDSILSQSQKNSLAKKLQLSQNKSQFEVVVDLGIPYSETFATRKEVEKFLADLYHEQIEGKEDELPHADINIIKGGEDITERFEPVFAKIRGDVPTGSTIPDIKPPKRHRSIRPQANKPLEPPITPPLLPKEGRLSKFQKRLMRPRAGFDKFRED